MNYARIRRSLRISSHSVWSGRSRLPPKSMRFLDLPCLAPTPSCATRDPVAGLRATCRCNSRISYCTFIFERLCKQCKFPVASRRGTSAARRPRTDYPGPGNTILAQRGKSECKVSAHSIIKILKPDGEPDTVLLLTLCSIWHVSLRRCLHVRLYCARVCCAIATSPTPSPFLVLLNFIMIMIHFIFGDLPW